MDWVKDDAKKRVIASWKLMGGGKMKNKVWKAALFCVFWAVQKQKIRIVFEEGERTSRSVR